MLDCLQIGKVKSNPDALFDDFLETIPGDINDLDPFAVYALLDVFCKEMSKGSNKVFDLCMRSLEPRVDVLVLEF